MLASGPAIEEKSKKSKGNLAITQLQPTRDSGKSPKKKLSNPKGKDSGSQIIIRATPPRRGAPFG